MKRKEYGGSANAFHESISTAQFLNVLHSALQSDRFQQEFFVLIFNGSQVSAMIYATGRSSEHSKFDYSPS